MMMSQRKKDVSKISAVSHTTTVKPWVSLSFYVGTNEICVFDFDEHDDSVTISIALNFKQNNKKEWFSLVVHLSFDVQLNL